MFDTKPVVNFLYKQIKERETIITHIQSVALWQRPILSAVTLLIIEILFAIVYFIKVRQITLVASTVAIIAIINVAQQAFPELFNKIFSFKIPEQNENASNRIRSPSELAAYFTTILSFFFDFTDFVFPTPETTNIIRLSISGFCMLVLIVAFYILGDFWINYLLVHLLFILPGALLHPRVYTILFGNEEADEAVNAQIPPSIKLPPSGYQTPPSTFDPDMTNDPTLTDVPAPSYTETEAEEKKDEGKVE